MGLWLVVHLWEYIYTYQRGCLSVSVNCKGLLIPRSVDSQRMTPRFFCGYIGKRGFLKMLVYRIGVDWRGG